ncbi:hypothetical protein PUR31_15470 [Pseudomonas mosselii]|uniref:hypothetical protein n=1 Tax=unclassified Pseudomonas TaxID=196821 RepID=UPI0020C347D5|nr:MULTISPECIES: hypothetical protein [unclassified Pseudomonas]MCP8634898.1 hypothetical protein [Pseudomonas sp. DVZ6]MDD7785491.1 hypothetical protein [Pseudomonas sp. DVZ24]
MKVRNWKTAWAGVLLAMVTVISAQAATPLFTVETGQDTAQLKKTATGYLARLLAEPANVEIKLVKVDAKLVNPQTQAIAVSTPDGKTVEFHLRPSKPLASGFDSWVGYKASEWKKKHASQAKNEIDYDPRYYLSLVRQQDKVVGRLIVDGQLYRLDYIGPGQHALIKVDESKLPAEARPLRDTDATDKITPSDNAKRPDFYEINVLLVSTKPVRESKPNYKEELIGALQDANQYFVNSKIKVIYYLAAIYDSNYEGDGSDLNELKSKDTELGKMVWKYRGALGAHLVSLYGTFTESCGVAYSWSTKETAYSAISCPSSLAHVLGQNYGGTVGWDPAPTNPLNHGYKRETAPEFHTQMVTAHGALPNFSNPRVEYQGKPMGDALHDMAQFIEDKRAEYVSSFYGPLNALSLSLYEQTDSQGEKCYLQIRSGQPVNISSACNEQPVRSFWLTNIGIAQRLCLYDGPGERHVCYTRTAEGADDVEVKNIDDSKDVPAGYIREQKGGALNGAVVDALHGGNAVLLFAEKNFKSPMCGFSTSFAEYLITEEVGCPHDAGGKARSARIFSHSAGSPPTSYWTFYNEDRSRTLNFKGQLYGKFGIADFDSPNGIPNTIERTQTGGAMNGNVHRFRFNISPPN